MTNELENLLAERPASLDEGGQDSGTVGRATSTPSPTVLDLDRFNLRRGRQIAEHWRGEKLVECEPEIAADSFAALFEYENELAENPADKHRAAWMKQLMETPEYQALHAQTVLENDLAALAAKPLVEQWLKYVEEQKPGEDGDDGDPGGEEEGLGKTLARIRSTQQALKQAQSDCDTAKDLTQGLGMGEGGSGIDRARLARYFKRVQNDSKLRAILAMAGRMRRLCRSLQKQKTHALRGEITGVELGGDISRLVMREKIELADVLGMPELQDRALYRLIRKRSLCYRHKKNEPQKQGPIVICVDESGSMGGDRIIAAKGLAMALAWLAQYQRRWVALVGFAGGTEGTRLALPPGHKQQDQLIEWLLHFYGGGTTLDVPLAEVPRNYWPEFVVNGMQRGKTDLILITDAIVDCPDVCRALYKAWAKQESVKTFGIIIGEREPGDLGQVCDKYWCIEDLDMESDAVTSVLSI